MNLGCFLQEGWFSKINVLVFFSGHERAVFYKSCNLIGSESGQYCPHPARSQRAVSDSLRDEITSIASLQLFIYQIDTYRINFSLFTANINFVLDSDHSESEFYYPDEVEKFSDKENIGSQRKEN